MYMCMYVHTCCVLPCRILVPRRCVCFVFLRPKIFTSGMRTYFYYVCAAVFASCFYVLFKFRLVRGVDQGSPLVNPLK